MPNLQRVAMPQFCLLFYAILQSWQPKGGDHGTMPPLSTPLVLTLKLDGIQYSAFAQFCPGCKSSEVVDLLSHTRSLTAKIIPRVEILQENL